MHACLCVTFDIRLRSGRKSGGPALAIALNDLKMLQNSVNAREFFEFWVSREISGSSEHYAHAYA